MAGRLELEKAETELMKRAFQRMDRFGKIGRTMDGMENSLSAEGRLRNGYVVRVWVTDNR